MKNEEHQMEDKLTKHRLICVFSDLISHTKANWALPHYNAVKSCSRAELSSVSDGKLQPIRSLGARGFVLMEGCDWSTAHTECNAGGIKTGNEHLETPNKQLSATNIFIEPILWLFFIKVNFKMRLLLNTTESLNFTLQTETGSVSLC